MSPCRRHSPGWMRAQEPALRRLPMRRRAQTSESSQPLRASRLIELALLSASRVPEARGTYGCCGGPRGPASAEGRALGGRLASHNGGRPPLGALTVAILGSGAALASPAFAPDRLQRAPRVRVVVPGWRLSVPPGATVASRYRGTPRLAPPSGCLRTTPFDERGWECFYCRPE